MRIVLSIGSHGVRTDEALWILGELLSARGFVIGERPEGGEPFVLVRYGGEEEEIPEGGAVVFTPAQEKRFSGRRGPGAPVEVYGRDGDPALAFPPFEALPGGEALWKDRRGNVAASLVRDGPPEVRFAFDLVAPARFFLSRSEEKSGERDPHDRYRPGASWFSEQDLFGDPVVDRLGLMIEQAIEAALGAARSVTTRIASWPGGETFAISLTHDQDQSVRWDRRIARHGLQMMRGGAGGRREGGRLLLRDLREGAVSPLHFSNRIVDWENREGIRSTFFFLASERDRFNRRYRIGSPPFRRFLKDLESGRFAVGLHGGLDSYLSVETMRAEKAVVEEAAGRELEGVRQHYLRLRIPETWQVQRDAGFRYDTTLGYPDTPGFRAGTGFPFFPPGMDDFLVIPLHGMDRALLAEGVTDHGAWDIWTSPVRRVGGLVDILWHPYFIDDDLGPEREARFHGLLSWISGWKKEAWVATLDEVARWWTARRQVAVESVLRRDGRTVVRYRFDAPLPSLLLSPVPEASDIRIEGSDRLRAERRGGGGPPRIALRDIAAGARLTIAIKPLLAGRGS